MSTWTHVVGCMRIDAIDTSEGNEELVKAIFGPMCLFDDWNENSTIPRGEEGSLQYKLIKYQEGYPWLAIPIWGDLRNFTDVQEIINWWVLLQKNLVNEVHNSSIRDALLRVQVEDSVPVILEEIPRLD